MLHTQPKVACRIGMSPVSYRDFSKSRFGRLRHGAESIVREWTDRECVQSESALSPSLNREFRVESILAAPWAAPAGATGGRASAEKAVM